jgi:hypothetical protein
MLPMKQRSPLLSCLAPVEVVQHLLVRTGVLNFVQKCVPPFSF